MYKRMYTSIKKEVRKDGTIAMYPEREWKWIKTNGPRRKQSPHGQAKTIYSKRFGYLNNYKHKELEMLRCPSGHSVPQCMNLMRKLWWAYMKSQNEADIKKMEKYARAIQAVQEDLGIKTASFPHLGIYGDVLIYYDHESKSKTKEIKTEVDHSELKAIQDIEEQKEKLPDTYYVPPLIEPDVEKGEELVTIADEIPKPQPKHSYRVKHENRMHFGKKREHEWVCENCDETVPANKNHICQRKEEEKSDVVTMTDDIPFLSEYQEN